MLQEECKISHFLAVFSQNLYLHCIDWIIFLIIEKEFESLSADCFRNKIFLQLKQLFKTEYDSPSKRKQNSLLPKNNLPRFYIEIMISLRVVVVRWRTLIIHHVPTSTRKERVLREWSIAPRLLVCQKGIPLSNSWIDKGISTSSNSLIFINAVRYLMKATAQQISGNK